MKAPRRVDSKGSFSKNPFRDNSYVSVALQDLLLGDSGSKKKRAYFYFQTAKFGGLRVTQRDEGSARWN